MQLDNLLNINTLELMRLWGELIEAYHGVNEFGGDTAEIYAYRFSWRERFANENDKIEHYQKLGEQLLSLVELFCDNYECSVEINGVWLKNIKKPFYFDYRCHVQIID